MTSRQIAVSTAVIFVVALLLSAMTPSVASAQRPNPYAIDATTDRTDPVLQRTLLALENDYWNAWKAKDWSTVKKLMGEDGIWVNDGLNVLSIEGFLKVVENLEVAFSIGPRSFVRKPAPGVAVFVYDVKIAFGRAGSTPSADTPYLISAVFVNRGGQWVGVSRSEVRGNRPQPPAVPSGNPGAQ